MSTPNPLSPILTVFSEAPKAATLTASCLETKELNCLSSSCKQFKILFTKTMIEKKQASELLYHIFNADSKKVKEFLENHSKANFGDCRVILTPSCCKEMYYSETDNEWLVKRSWDNISPLEAAAWCGNNALVKELLGYVQDSQKKLAASQLKGMLKRNCDAENGEYLHPYKRLHDTYQCFIKASASLYKVLHLGRQKDYLNDIWGCQHFLPAYGLKDYGKKRSVDSSMCTGYDLEPDANALEHFCKTRTTELRAMIDDLENISKRLNKQSFL